MKKYFINFFTVLIALISLGFSLFRVYPCEIGNDTYIGIIVTLLGICVTFVIGYQIYNSIEIKESIRRFQALEKRIEISKEIIEQQKLDMDASLRNIYAQLFFKNNQKLEAIKEQLKGLIPIIKSNCVDNSFENAINSLKGYIPHLDNSGFIQGGGTPEKMDKRVAEIKKEIETIDREIKTQKNYRMIKSEYEHILKCLYQRLEYARLNKDYSKEEDKELFRE